MVRPHPVPASTVTAPEDKPKPKTTVYGRRSNELVIAFSGPVGCGQREVIDIFREDLENREYKVFHVKLSHNIETAYKNGVIQPDAKDDNRYLRLQTGGDKLREKFNNYVLAEAAIAEIAKIRVKEFAAEDPRKIIPDRKIAYLIDQLKHPDEAKFLKQVYGNLFYLVGVFAPENQRQRNLESLADSLASDAISKIMRRDRNENVKYGQKLDKTLHRADYFIRNSANQVDHLTFQVKRLLKLVHGHPVVSPTVDEYGMYAAYSAGLRSACLSRQVGAAIADTEGNVIATGANDVPRPTGGLYEPADGTSDNRCFNLKGGICFNDKKKSDLEKEIRMQVIKALQEFEQKGYLEIKVSEDASMDERRLSLSAEVASQIREFTRVRDLIEFSRSVHAEMDAIVTVARSGSASVAGATLYSTVFPCHNCARHIIAAGISKVVFIEPYEKSLALDLHGDAISVDGVEWLGSQPSENGTKLKKVEFLHFEGVAPSKYSQFFTPSGERKENGKMVKVIDREAETISTDYIDPYTKVELKVAQEVAAFRIVE